MGGLVSLVLDGDLTVGHGILWYYTEYGVLCYKVY